MIYKPTGQTSQVKARQVEARLRSELAMGNFGILERKRPVTLSSFIDNRLEPWAKTRPSWLWFRSGIRPLKSYAGIADKPLNEITSEVIADYSAHRQAEKRVTGTVNRELRVLRRALRLAVEWGVLDRAPRSDAARREAPRASCCRGRVRRVPAALLAAAGRCRLRTERHWHAAR